MHTLLVRPKANPAFKVVQPLPELVVCTGEQGRLSADIARKLIAAVLSANSTGPVNTQSTKESGGKSTRAT